MFNFSFGAFTPGDASRLRRVEEKLDLILTRLGIEYVDTAPENNLSEQVRDLADRGEKIPAIKAYREQTGAGLAEAKRVVEAYLGRRL
jgi:ribosomal protein L7/L12